MGDTTQDVWVYGRHNTRCLGIWETHILMEQYLKTRQDTSLFLQNTGQQNPFLHLLSSNVISSIFSPHEDIHALVPYQQSEYHPAYLNMCFFPGLLEAAKSSSPTEARLPQLHALRPKQ